MSAKLVSAIVLSAVLTFTCSTVASAEAFQTNDGKVIVTGLKPTQRYQIRTLSMEDRPGTRQDKAANRCGEVVIEAATRYKKLTVGTETVEPASLPVQEYTRCRPQSPTSSRMQPTGVVRATTPQP